MFRLCLCMIVRNEARTILDTLDSVVQYIDYWVVSDTGSTDDTADKMTRYFEEKGIPGELHHDEWKDFAHNRTRVFQHAYQKSD